MGYDHCFVLPPRKDLLSPFACLCDPKSGRCMTVATTLPGVQVYSGNFLLGKEEGKYGLYYNRHEGICFETQFFPDSPNHENFPSCVLSPDKEFRSTTIYAFFVR
jgi:aldose 1-epimerase